MSHGPGVVQRRVLDALTNRANKERYPVLDDEIIELVGRWAGPEVIRARWRWYTIGILGLANEDSSRSDRVSLHRAIKTLANNSRIETASRLPYPQPFAAYVNSYDRLVDGVNLNELAHIDQRWPSLPDRALWFRLPTPHLSRAAIPEDDQLAVLEAIDTHRPDPFEDFVATVDHEQRWTTPVGRFLAWLFCGSPNAD